MRPLFNFQHYKAHRLIAQTSPLPFYKMTISSSLRLFTTPVLVEYLFALDAQQAGLQQRASRDTQAGDRDKGRAGDRQGAQQPPIGWKAIEEPPRIDQQ